MNADFPKSARAAWIAVGVLWLMAFLYYFDRLLLTSMRDAIRADLQLNDAQFGLLTSSFLWVYGLLCPVGGYIADRFGRRPILLGSLALWSVAVWLTGNTRTFEQLLAARVLMGISEACFLPAALALLSNHHRTRTRSFATGLFNTGIYAGGALGGIGGWLADQYGWRLQFSLLAAVGVIYTVIAVFALQDAPPPAEPDRSGGERPGVLAAMRALLAKRGFWFLFGVFCVVSVANWLFYGWLPTFLRERFNLSHAVAGLSATGLIPIGTFSGVIFGGLWADRWSRWQPRGRAWVAAIGIGLAAPALFVAGSATLFPAVMAALIVFGVGRGFFDSNCMPILREVSTEKYSATGYGLLNMTGCIMGGLATYGGGVLLDAKIPLTIVFQCAAVGMVFVAIGLACLKTNRP
jgi:predicted MFS family arabinose efflux permease